LSVSLPIEVVVLNCWVTATNDTPARIEHLDHLREVGQRAREPIDLVDHHYIDETFADICEQPL
jgi:hypothetical protein